VILTNFLENTTISNILNNDFSLYNALPNYSVTTNKRTKPISLVKKITDAINYFFVINTSIHNFFKHLKQS
jgi:hypothetical protein